MALFPAKKLCSDNRSSVASGQMLSAASQMHNPVFKLRFAEFFFFLLDRIRQMMYDLSVHLMNL